ncbi:MAG: Gfo/Idh/MocA family oxidoreductase [Chthoniobacterales bacterium]
MMTKIWKSPAEIRVGVIGYGGAFTMGKAHLDEMRAAGMTPAAVAEIDPVRLAAAAADFPGIATYSSAAQMAKSPHVDLVTIITPHNTHAKIGRQCLRGGKHVVCEKPPGPDHGRVRRDDSRGAPGRRHAFDLSQPSLGRLDPPGGGKDQKRELHRRDLQDRRAQGPP